MNQAHRALRDRTAQAHERVDALFAGFDLGNRTHYAAMLAAHAEVLLPLETALDAADTGLLFSDWAERKRGAAIVADLAELDGPSISDGTLPSPSLATRATAERSAAVAGMLYVLEGSRHGGRFLARQLPPDFPRRYLDADQAPGKWRDLLFKIEPILYSPHELNVAVDAALEVFNAFEHSGRKWLVKE